MDIATRKYKFIEQFINTINDDKIELFESLLESQSEENEIVAYTVKGEPLTKKQYIQEIEESEKDIAAGRVISASDLLKEIKNW